MRLHWEIFTFLIGVMNSLKQLVASRVVIMPTGPNNKGIIHYLFLVNVDTIRHWRIIQRFVNVAGRRVQIPRDAII